MRYSPAPAYDPKSGLYKGKGDGSKGKKIPKEGAITTVGRNRKNKENGSAGESASNGDPRKKVW